MIRALSRGLLLAAFSLPWFEPATVAAQDEGAFDRTPQDCITVTSINKTDAIDDQTIIFYMRGRRAYRNHMPRSCPGLERENRMAYETRGARLCSSDTITVLEQFGVGLQRGFTCRLGEFVPLSREEIEDLQFREDEGRPSQRGIETQSVELEDDDATEAAPDPAGDAPAEQAPPGGEQP